MGETYRIQITVDGQDNASAPIGKVGGALGNLGNIAGGILGANLIQNLISGITNLGKTALTAYADYERLGMSLQSLTAREMVNSGMASSLGDAMDAAGEQAKGLQGWIQELAIKSPFKQKDIADSFRLAMAYGFTTKESQRLTTAMVDFSSATGASGDSMNRIALALGQIKARGKLAGGEIMQLTEAGIPVRQILAKSFNVTTAELEDMISKGLVPADTAIEAITSSLENDFGGAAERQAATFSGLISSLSDIKEVGLREFFAGTFKAVQPYLTNFVDTLSSPETMASIKAMGDNLGASVSTFLTQIKPAGDFLKNLFATIANSEAASIIKDMFSGLGETFAPFMSNMGNMFSSAFAGVGQWFTDNEPLINAFLANVSTAVQFIGEAITNLFPIIQTSLGFAIGTIENIGMLIMQVFTGDFAGALETGKTILTDALTFVTDTLQNIAVWVLDTFFGMTLEEARLTVNTFVLDVTGFFQNLWAKAGEYINGIGTFFTNIKTKIDNAIQSVKDFLTDIKNAVIPDWLSDVLGNSTGGTSGRAIGGPVSAGRDYIVGERGPELFRSKTPGTIIPNDKLSSYRMSAAASVLRTINLTVNNNGRDLDPNSLASSINAWETAYGF
jgi:tape measure domain-containing protein